MSQPRLPEGFSDVGLLLDELTDGVTIIGRDWTIRFNNAAALALARQPAEALLGHSLWALSPQVEHSEIGRACRRAMASGQPETIEAQCAELDLALRILPRAEGLLVLSRDVSEVRQTQQALREIQDRYRLVLRATQGALWEWDLASDEVTWNERLTEQYGYPEQAWTTEQRWDARIHPEERAEVRARLDAALVDPSVESWSAEYRFETSSAGYVRVLDNGAILRDHAGAARWMVGALKDLSLRPPAPTMSSIVWSANRAGELCGDLRAWCAFTGQSEVQIRETLGLGAVHPEDRGGLRASWLAAVAAESQSFEYEYRLRRHDRRSRSVRLRAVSVRDEHGKIVEWVGTIMDQTALRQAEAALAESRGRYQKIADSAPVILWVTDAEGRCVSLNQSWYDFTGAAPRQVPDDPWVDRVHPDDLAGLRSARHTSTRHHEAYRAEYRLRDADGEYRWMLDSALPRLDGGETHRGYVGCLFDISERKLVERERERLLQREADARREAEDASRLKDEFLAAISHELRTPLNAVLGWAQMLRRGVLSEAQQANAVLTIERNARLQSQLIEDLLDVSRIVSGKLRLDLEPLDLRDVIEQAVASIQPAAAKAGVTLRIELGELRSVTGDSARLQQIIWNLLSNGVKFTPAGGRVTLTSRLDADEIVLQIADTGDGIAPEFIDQVFDRFRQASSGSARQRTGLGLGLAIVRSLVELHGGTIDVHSDGLQAGTTFTVRLPISRESLPLSSGEMRLFEAAELPSLAGLTILVVDDEPDARDVLGALLESRGAVVHVEESAAMALTRLQVVLPDMLLSDIGMPEMDGYALIAHVRALPPNRGGNTPAVALTAYARPQDRARALMAGFQNHIAKPVEPTELMAVIQSLLGGVPGR